MNAQASERPSARASERPRYRVAVLSTGRQDWGILKPVITALADDLTVQLLAGGRHRRAPRIDDVRVAAWVAGPPHDDDDLAVARAAAATTDSVAQALTKLRSDALLVVGDRTETLAAGLAATCLRLPLIHLHGGETSTGAIDDACRHALSRLAALHGVAHRDFATRLKRWEIPAQRIIVCGAPALDTLLTARLPDEPALAAFLGRPLTDPLVLVTHHPATLGADPKLEADAIVAGLTHALRASPHATVVCTRPNADAGGRAIAAAWTRAARRDRRWRIVDDLGSERWWALMARARVLVGNSSSALLEAPSFRLSAVNVGDRQHGRLRLSNIIDAPPRAAAIAAAITRALGRTPRGVRAPRATAYGDGNAAVRIAAAVVALLDHGPRTTDHGPKP
jgi:UDP-hydrolysing UDP-N-acetyl-D-glucosamine 2-epimerase